jgi:phospholipase C
MFRFVLERLGVFLFCMVLASCGGDGSTQSQTDPPPPNPQISVPRSGITHLMIVVMQNASFDHLFGTYPGGTHGLDSSLPSYHQIDQAGNTITAQLMTNLSPADLHHTATS